MTTGRINQVAFFPKQNHPPNTRNNAIQDSILLHREGEIGLPKTHRRSTPQCSVHPRQSFRCGRTTADFRFADPNPGKVSAVPSPIRRNNNPSVSGPSSSETVPCICSHSLICEFREIHETTLWCTASPIGTTKAPTRNTSTIQWITLLCRAKTVCHRVIG